MKNRRRCRRSCIITQAIAAAIARFEAICPMLEFRRQLTAGNSPQYKYGAEWISTMEKLSQCLAQLNCVSRGTIWTWYRRFLRDGYSGLFRVSRADQGSSRFFATHFRSAALVTELAIQSQRSAFSIHNELLRSGEATPSYNSTREFIKSLRRSTSKTR